MPEDVRQTEWDAAEATAPGHGACRALLGVLGRLSSLPSESGDLAASLLAVLVDHLDASGSSLALVRTQADGVERLVTVAGTGRYEALLRDMPPVELDSPLEGARVWREGRPLYVDDLHAVASSDRPDATARWRDSIATQSYVVLPLALGDEVSGVLTLQWATTVRFDEGLAETLEAVATLFALALGRSSHQPAEGEPQAARAGSLLRFDQSGAIAATEDGAVLAVTADAGEDVLVVHQVMSAGRLRLGAFASPTAGEALGETARAVSETAARLADAPVRALETVNRAVPASAPSVGVSAWVGEIDLTCGVVTSSSAGVVTTEVLGPGRVTSTRRSADPPLGLWREAAYAEQHLLLLSGDRLVVAFESGPRLEITYAPTSSGPSARAGV